MADIRAFVGHSFTEGDEALVRVFTDYFDQVANLVPEFSWTHAEPAEPKQLAEKVMQLISDCNAFIAICTRKEYAVEPTEIGFGFAGRSLVKNNLLRWKASDWIIQEIGLARGKGLDLILLIEDGVRDPGGLQGHIEYIKFDRNAPQKAFGKLLEMIRVLVPRAPSSATIRPEAGVAAAAQNPSQPDPSQELNWTEPQPDWNRTMYEIAFTHNIVMRNDVVASRIADAYLSTVEGKEHELRASWQAFSEYWRIVTGIGGDIDKLRELAASHPDNPRVQRYLGDTYQHFGEFEKAAELYETAIANESSNTRKIETGGMAAVAHVRAGRKSAALATIIELRREVVNVEINEIQFLRVLSDFGKESGDDDMIIASLERILQLKPTNHVDRFSLAYAHSEMNNNDLALFHYMKIPLRARDKMAWNNLGVIFSHFTLRAKCINAFREGADSGETLAMSNLAQTLALAGFLDEAQALCDRAMSMPNYHENIIQILARLREIPNEENAKEKEILDQAQPKLNFYQNFGEAMIKDRRSNLDGRWEGPDCLLQAVATDSRFEAFGSFDKQEGVNALLFGGGGARSVRYEVRYEGEVVGQAIEASVKRVREGESAQPRTLLSAAVEDAIKVLMVAADDGNSIAAMEVPRSGAVRFYRLERTTA